MEKQLKEFDKGWWVVSRHGKIWLPNGELPLGSAVQWQLVDKIAHYLGEWQSKPVWLIEESRPYDMCSLRQLLAQEQELFQLAGRGVQLAAFFQSHQFCGYCGYPTVTRTSEWACLCSHCHQCYYPQIAPCIIVAIRWEEQILLAQHHRHGFYTALAGFVEVGETLEQTVRREVMEECSIQVKNLRYVTSQPWPFPHSLMMAFMADYDSGELQHDPSELLDAAWFHYEQLPSLPPMGTVARPFNRRHFGFVSCPTGITGGAE